MVFGLKMKILPLPKNYSIGKGISRGAEWRKFQLRSTLPVRSYECRSKAMDCITQPLPISSVSDVTHYAIYRRQAADLWGRVHEVELQEVLDSEGLEQQHHVGEVGALDLRHRGDQHLVLVCRLCVQPVALPAGREGGGGEGRGRGDSDHM